MDPYLIEKIKKLSTSETGSEEIEKLLDQYVKIHPDDIEAWIRLAVTVFRPPIADYDKSIDCLKKAIEVDSNCLKAILILMRIQDTIYQEIDENVFRKINSIEATGVEEQSMIEFAKSWYFESKQMWDEYASHLKKSIELYPKHVLNHIYLGYYYIDKGKQGEGKSFLFQGLKNIQYIYQDDDCFYDVSDYDEFINERIKGIHATYVIYESLEERIKSL